MDAPDRKDFPPFSIGSETMLDRMAQMRGDGAWIEQRLANRTSRFLLLADLSIGVETNTDRSKTGLRWHSAGDIEKLGVDLECAMLLYIAGIGRALLRAVFGFSA